MLEKLLRELGYTSFYFISYVGKSGVYGSMNMTVKPYITLNNYKSVLNKVNELAGEEVAITCIQNYKGKL